MRPIREKIYYIIAKHKVINLAKTIIPKVIRTNFRVLYRKFRYGIGSINAGEPVYCPIDKEYFKVFPMGLTPTTGAKARHRLFWLFLEKETKLLEGKNTILHCAPQFGVQKRLKSYPMLNYIAGDKRLPGYDYSEDTLDIDLLGIDFKAGHFDYVICNRVLEHIEDDEKAISEIFRVLKSGGEAFVTVPIDGSLEETHESFNSVYDRVKYYGQWDHVRMYALDIKGRFEKAGFNVEINKYSDNYNQEEFRKYGLCVDRIIIAKKP